jgi:hypothetical protein
MLAEYESELDTIWPGWRRHEPFGALPYDHRARIKWLLKRHELVAAGRDWPVLIVRDGKNPTKCYAHPIPPDGSGVTPDIPPPPRDVPLPAASLAAGRAGAGPSPSMVAFRLRLPVEVVEAALDAMPPGTTDVDAWVRSWAEGRREKASAMPAAGGAA